MYVPNFNFQAQFERKLSEEATQNIRKPTEKAHFWAVRKHNGLKSRNSEKANS